MSDPLNVVSSNTDYGTIPVWSQMGDNGDDEAPGACAAAPHVPAIHLSRFRVRSLAESSKKQIVI